ncbi:MAG: SRPBCC family protein [Actinomycetota bacterium]
MAEQLNNEFTVNRPIEEAWPIITDVEKIAPCLPGAELQEIAESDEWGEVYRGVVKVKLGAISTQFKGDAHFVERDDENHRAELKGKGRDTGGRGNASADIVAVASSLSPTSTKVEITTELHITGKVAQFGRGILGDVSTKLIDQFATNLNEMLDAEDDSAADTADTEGATEVEEPTDESAAGDGDADRASAAQTGSVSDASGEEPTVRKINGPAAEPIDLMDVSGGSIAKRIGPAIAGVLVLLFLLRRLRR